MNTDRLELLFKRFSKGEASTDDLAELDDWFHQQRGGTADFKQMVLDAGGELQLENQLYTQFNNRLYKQQRVRRLQTAFRIAAMLLLALGCWGYFKWYTVKQQNFIVRQQQKQQRIVPAGNKATITLADGSKIDLDESKQGDLAKQAGVDIKKISNGQVVYQPGASDVAGNTLAWNTIATPRAGQYELILPDGTKVWLNAETKLRYPVRFDSAERRVELTGEAYFEVAHDKAKPFLVSTATQLITVLGTHFNINGYADEDDVTTTLFEGSVKVANQTSGKTAMLVPGKQAIILKGEGNIEVATAQLDKVMAWRNGYFVFDNEDIKDVMKVISRWYDVDVSFNLHKTVRLGGTFSRYSDLHLLLKDFAILGNVKCELKERRIIISN